MMRPVCMGSSGTTLSIIAIVDVYCIKLLNISLTLENGKVDSIRISVKAIKTEKISFMLWKKTRRRFIYSCICIMYRIRTEYDILISENIL